ncbi:MAG: hypothetical protein VKL97_04555 [Cyanobacteriota bacterium]|nr:hypothetical protein [Cyanobacteriota bacterium]
MLALCLLLPLGLAPAAAAAAEVLQVRSATLLQVGDQNRSYGVELACLVLNPEQQQQATDWLRQDLPRRTRVNLRPRGSDQGVLLAQVERLDRRSDVAHDLVAAGYGAVVDGCAT